MYRLRIDNFRADRRLLCLTRSGNVLMRGTGSSAESAKFYISADSCITDYVYHTLPNTHFATEMEYLPTADVYIGRFAYWDTTSASTQRYIAKSADLITWHQIPELGDIRWLPHGICDDAEGNIYIGHYLVLTGDYLDGVGTQNPERFNGRDIKIFKSTDGGLTFSTVFNFENGATRHIHAVQYDPFSGHIWCATGDFFDEIYVGYSTDGGVSFTWIDQGRQEARTTGFLFTEGYVHFGIDTNTVLPYMRRYDRQTTEIINTGLGRTEWLLYAQWEPSLLISTSHFNIAHTDNPMNDYFLMCWDEENWYPTHYWTIPYLLEATGSCWILTKQDKNGYAHAWMTDAFSQHRGVIRIKVEEVEIKTAVRNVISNNLTPTKPVNNRKREIRFIGS